MDSAEDELQPAGLSHESAIGMTAERAALTQRRTRSAEILQARGFRAEHFMLVPDGARRAWGIRYTQLESIRQRLERLRRSASSDRGAEARWGDDGWWKWLSEESPGEQGLCVRLGSEKRFYLSEQQVARIEDRGNGAFAAFGHAGQLLLEARLSKPAKDKGKVQRRSQQESWDLDASTGRSREELVRRMEMANSVRIPNDRWLRCVQAYDREFSRRRPDGMAAMYIAARCEATNYMEAVAVSARLEALLGWETHEPRRRLSEIAPNGFRKATMDDVVQAANRARLHVTSAGIRFQVEQIEDLVADLVSYANGVGR